MVVFDTHNSALEYNLDVSEEVEHICRDVFKRYSLNYFAYLIFLKNGSILRLSNHLAWTKDYFRDRLYNENSYYMDHWKRVSFGEAKKFLWVAQPETKIHQGWRKNNIGNGCSIYKRKANLLETCSFGTYLENYKANDLYIKYGSDFEDFVEFFKRKAAHLLSLDQSTRLITPNKKILMNNQNKNDFYLNKEQIDSFLNKINIT